MTQKITYCIVTSQWDDDEGRYVDTWHKDKLYDLDDKADVKALAVELLNLNLQQGVKTCLKTYIERESLSFSAKDLGIK